MLMTALFGVFVGGFVAITALGHILVLKALVLGRSQPQPSPQPLARHIDGATAAP